MRLATCDEMRRIEARAEGFGATSEILMETAGALAAREITQIFVSEIRGSGGVAVICGPGNNGGDGLVVVRHLRSMGVKNVKAFVVAEGDRRSEGFALQAVRLEKWGVPLQRFSPEAVGRPSLIVDAVFGVGLNRNVGSPFHEAIDIINNLRLPVVALDCPSGLDADRGLILGAAIRASQTLTFGISKPGFYISDGPKQVGSLRILPVGFPRELMLDEAKSCVGISEKMARAVLPKRSATGNKSSNGHALILAGGPGMYGSALLASSSAQRIGAGYVTLASDDEPLEVLKTYPEILTAKIEDEKLWVNPKWKSCGIGPGLGTTDEAADKIEKLLRKLIEMGAERVVVDADALTAIAKKQIWPLPSSWIVTPHAGELSRLIGVDSKVIESDRIRYAREGARKLGCHVLLKGFRTVIASLTDARVYIVLSGNSALAKAGTGDVLTGMITGLMAQNVEPLKAAMSAAYIHGRIADEWVRAGEDRRSMQASDLREILPRLIARL